MLRKTMFVRYKKIIIFLFAVINLFIDLYGQTERNSIAGKVFDALTEKPISGATVQVIGTKFGAITKSDGSFNIKNLEPGIYSIRFSVIGYETYVESNVYVTNVKPVYLEIKLVQKTIEVEGLEVRGKYFERFVETTTSTQTFSAEEIRRAPGVQEDVIRAVALLPGVGVTQAGRNDLVVRGGAPYENLFIIDNIEVPNINHFGAQGTTGGPLAIVNIDFVKSVQFSTGGFGAKYGDKVSLLTVINLFNGNSEKFGGKAIVSATGFGLNLEGPINDQGSFFFSVRRSYLDLLFKLAGFAFIPQYWDFQGKINYRIDEKNRLQFLSIGALDDVILNNDNQDNKFKNSRVAVPEQKQYFSGLSYLHTFDNALFSVTVGRSYVKFYTFQNDSNLNTILLNNSREGETSFKTELDWNISKTFNLVLGNQIKWASLLDYEITIDGLFRRDKDLNPVPLSVDTGFTAIRNGSFATLTATIGKHRVAFGLRGDYYNFTKEKFFLSPRVSVSYMINPVSTIIFSLGRYYQPPSYVWLVGSPLQQLNPIRADLVVLGYEHTPFEDLKVQLEAYYKIYRNYPARVFRPQAVLAPSGFEDITSDIPFGLEPLSSEGSGWSRGVELIIQKRFSPQLPLFGLMSVTVSQTKFKGLDGIERISKYDSPLIFNLAIGYRINPEWEISYKYRAAIGVPTTPFLENGFLDYSKYNEGDRLPIFRSTDFRVDKRWFFTNFNLVTYLDIQNLFGTKNKSGVRWNPRERKSEYLESIGVLPSIGVYLEF